ncbi:MAG: hypothetical protein HYY18_20305 [Planctomycetes bacterium]|nr:hypothetical protein [Planctomycetota bacterium]
MKPADAFDSVAIMPHAGTTCAVSRFVGIVRRMRREALARMKERGSTQSGWGFVAWADRILSDPAIAAQAFDEGARRLLEDLSKPDGAASVLPPHAAFRRRSN